MPNTPISRRARLARTALFLTAAALAGGACSPQQHIAAVFGDQTASATRIAECESTLNPTAVSRTNDHGLFQINGVHEPEFEAVTGQPWSAVYNPYWNTVYAKHLYDTQGWRPWTCRYAA